MPPTLLTCATLNAPWTGKLGGFAGARLRQQRDGEELPTLELVLAEGVSEKAEE